MPTPLLTALVHLESLFSYGSLATLPLERPKPLWPPPVSETIFAAATAIYPGKWMHYVGLHWNAWQDRLPAQHTWDGQQFSEETDDIAHPSVRLMKEGLDRFGKGCQIAAKFATTAQLTLLRHSIDETRGTASERARRHAIVDLMEALYSQRESFDDEYGRLLPTSRQNLIRLFERGRPPKVTGNENDVVGIINANKKYSHTLTHMAK